MEQEKYVPNFYYFSVVFCKNRLNWNKSFSNFLIFDLKFGFLISKLALIQIFTDFDNSWPPHREGQSPGDA